MTSLYNELISKTHVPTQEANLVEEVEDSPVEHRFLIGMDRSTNGPLPDCDRKYVSVRTMPPGNMLKILMVMLYTVNNMG